jgi:5-methylcytosine-specific restriction protein A
MEAYDAEPVVACGSLALGSVYRRRDLHLRFGGNRCTGIAPCTGEPVVLLFHTEEPAHQFYRDRLDDEWVYWYSGEGAAGDMAWNAANRAVAWHAAERKDLLFFKRVRRQGGLWRFCQVMHCLGWRWEERPDRRGRGRKAIVFALAPLEGVSASQALMQDLALGGEASQDLAVEGAPELVADKQACTRRLLELKCLAAVLGAAVLRRSGGVCEACGAAAPFATPAGGPFLELHYLGRHFDGGPASSDAVAAVCPNCHRRCHFGADGRAFDESLASRVRGRLPPCGAIAP